MPVSVNMPNAFRAKAASSYAKPNPRREPESVAAGRTSVSQSVKRIYLASRSPRRRELLHQIGIAFEVLPLRLDLKPSVDIDETPLAREAPDAYVMRIARAKAVAGWGLIVTHCLPHHPVLAADTTVVLDNEIIGKPDNARHARSMLRRLSGKTHQAL